MVDRLPEISNRQKRQSLQRLWDEGRAKGRESFAAGGAVSLMGAQNDQMSENSFLPYDPLEVDLIADQFEEAMNG